MSQNGILDPTILAHETVWEASKLQEAEAHYQEHLASLRHASALPEGGVHKSAVKDVMKTPEKDCENAPITAFAHETVWEVSKLQEAEAHYQEHLTSLRHASVEAEGDNIKSSAGKDVMKTPEKDAPPTSVLVNEIANVRSKIQKYMNSASTLDSLFPTQISDRLKKVEEENIEFRKTLIKLTSDMQEMLQKLNAIDLKVSIDSASLGPETLVKAQNSSIKNGTSSVKNGPKGAKC